MTFGTTLFLIVALIVAWGMYDSRNRHLSQGRSREDDDEPRAMREAELKAEIEHLRERLHVLERIATDDREAKRIAAEIEALRDDAGQTKE